MEISVGIGNICLPKTVREGRGKSVIAFPDEYCVVDIETTGMNPNSNDIIEIGAIKYNKGVELERFQTLVQPPLKYGVYVFDFITELTGITNEMLAGAPLIEEVLSDFDVFIGNSIIIGYNVGFDINFLYDAFERYLNKPLSNDCIDILRFSRKIHPEMAHHRLCDMVNKFHIPVEGAHRAIADVIATEECYKLLKDEAMSIYGSEESFVNAFKRRKDGGIFIKAKDIIGDESKKDTDSPLYNRYCVFTGKLDKLTRSQAMQVVADLGGINEDNVTKKTNYLILGNNDYCATIKDGKSSKHKKAEKYRLEGQDIEILPETVFYDMISDLL